MPAFRPLRTLQHAAASAVLAAAPAGGANAGAMRVALCADAGKRFVEIDIQGGGEEQRGHGACHVACLASRKIAKPRPRA